MGGGWARSLGGLPRWWTMLRRHLICRSHNAVVFSTDRADGAWRLDRSYARGYNTHNTIQGRRRPMRRDCVWPTLKKIEIESINAVFCNNRIVIISNYTKWHRNITNGNYGKVGWKIKIKAVLDKIWSSLFSFSFLAFCNMRFNIWCKQRARFTQKRHKLRHRIFSTHATEALPSQSAHMHSLSTESQSRLKWI